MPKGKERAAYWAVVVPLSVALSLMLGFGAAFCIIFAIGAAWELFVKSNVRP
jgi:hypothetical protein